MLAQLFQHRFNIVLVLLFGLRVDKYVVKINDADVVN